MPEGMREVRLKRDETAQEDYWDRFLAMTTTGPHSLPTLPISLPWDQSVVHCGYAGIIGRVVRV